MVPWVKCRSVSELAQRISAFDIQWRTHPGHLYVPFDAIGAGLLGSSDFYRRYADKQRARMSRLVTHGFLSEASPKNILAA